MTFAARIRNGELRVSTSIACASCELAQESDSDQLNDAARAAFYAREGKWSLFVTEWGTRKLEVVRMLERMCGLQPRGILQRVSEKRPIRSGALVELEQITEALQPMGVAFTRFRTPILTAENTNYELRQFFGGYFHQDWDIAAPDWEGVVNVFLDETRDPATAIHIATLIDDFLASHQDETEPELERLLFKDLCCEYLPSGGGLSARAWLTEVSNALRLGSGLNSSDLRDT